MSIQIQVIFGCNLDFETLLDFIQFFLPKPGNSHQIRMGILEKMGDMKFTGPPSCSHHSNSC